MGGEEGYRGERRGEKKEREERIGMHECNARSLNEEEEKEGSI